MPVYKEKKDKLKFNLKNTDDPVKLTITPQNGTEASVSYGFPPNTVNSNNSTKTVGAKDDLTGKSVTFSGAANNPLGNNKIKHTITQGASVPLIYTFPDDYDGEEGYSDTGDSISFEFNVNFSQI